MDEGDDAFDDFIVELLGVEELGKQVVVSIRQRGRATRLQSFADREDAVRYARTGGEHERRVAKARPSWILAALWATRQDSRYKESPIPFGPGWCLGKQTGDRPFARS